MIRLLLLLLHLFWLSNVQAEYFNENDLRIIKNHTGLITIDLDESLGLQYKDSSNNKIYFKNVEVANCTAVIISPNHLLTAAHCTDLMNTSQILKKVSFRLPNHSNVNVRTQKFSFKKILSSKKYTKYNSLFNKNFLYRLFFKEKIAEYDLAIIEMKQTLPFHRNILLQDNAAEESHTLVSFSFNNGLISKVQGSFKICSPLEVKKVIKGACIQQITQGNSGGPLFTKVAGRVHLIGITSTRVSSLFDNRTSYYFSKLSQSVIEQLAPQAQPFLSQIPLKL